MHQASERLTDAAGFLGRPLVVLLTGDVLLPHQLEGGQALEVQPVTVAKARPLPFAIGWDPRVAAAALFNFCQKTPKHIGHVKWISRPSTNCCQKVLNLA